MAGTSLPVIVEKETYAKFGACVHCGLCLPACPTYVETHDEADSPRGRIHLMKALADGRIGASDKVFEHLDRCLVCRACETACPSGVKYHELIEAIRPQVAEAALGKGKRMKGKMLQWVVGNVLPYSRRVAAGMGPLKIARKIGLARMVDRMMPGAGELADTVRHSGPAPELPRFTPAQGKLRGSVVLLRGCVGSVLSATTNAAAAKLLATVGFDVHLLADEPCCGAMAAHANDPEAAREFARATVRALLAKGGDFFISPIAGCGAQLKSLSHTLRGDPLEADARTLAPRIRDITEFLAEVGLSAPLRRIERTVVYHDPCHLIHAQRIADAPRKLLAAVGGLKVVPLMESDMCCGAAGTYNLTQPEMAEKLGDRKAAFILESKATEVITANIGCALQIARSLNRKGNPLPVRHLVELLAEALS